MFQMIHYPVELWLITLHLIGEFPLQPNWMAEKKTDRIEILTAHSAIHGLLFAPLGWLIYPRLSGAILFAGWIFVAHWVIDYRKWFSPNQKWPHPEYSVWINQQILHFIALSLAFWVVELIRPTPF